MVGRARAMVGLAREYPNAYVAGDTDSSGFPTTPGAFDVTYNGFHDVFVTKLDSSGSTLLYSTYLGGNSTDIAKGIAVSARARTIAASCERPGSWAESAI